MQPYGREIQAGIPELSTVIVEFLRVSAELPDAGAIQWRYDPVRHKSVFNSYPVLRTIAAEEDELLNDLAAIAARQGMELRVCCNPEYEGRFPAAACFFLNCLKSSIVQKYHSVVLS